jgi:exonuclease III
MRLLFWNVQKKDVPSEFSAFCQAREIDIVLLAEPGPHAKALGESLSAPGVGGYLRLSPTTERFEVFSRLSYSQLRPKHDDGRFSIWRLHPATGADFTVVVVHLPSKLHARNDLDQHESAQKVIQELQRVELEVGDQSSLIIGDFNMHPFDDGMVAANAFHGVMDRQIAFEKSRKVQGQSYDYFYNPMWSRMGDASKGPPGTHSYRDSGIRAFFWHTFDQVLIRPSLLNRVPDQNVEVISALGTLSLLNNSGKIAPTSDHLPLMVEVSD